ncbi:MAG: hypothetical protein AAF502_05175 [Bacteroidota bacterium]
MNTRFFIKYCSILLVALSLSAYSFGQMGADAGDDQVTCAGDMITLGGSPTYPESGASFTWTASFGPTPAPVANPMVTIPETGAPQEITYTVMIRTSSGFECEDEVVVTVVSITQPTFSPSFYVLGDGAMVTPTAMITPPERMITWSISDDPAGTGCMIDPMTGVVSGCMTAGTITVRAADSEDSECYMESELCVNDEVCCVANGNRSWGPISVTIPTEVNSMNADADGYCEFSTAAEITIGMEDIFNFSGSLTGVNISWKEKNPLDFKEITIEWTGSQVLGTFGVIEGSLTNVSLTIDASGTISGMATFAINQVTEASLGGVVILKPGLSGNVTYTYSGSGLGGSWNFESIAGFLAEIRVGGTPIGNVVGSSFDANGAMSASFIALPATYMANNFTVTMETLNLDFDLQIGTSMEVDFTGGTGQVKLSNMQFLEGEITLGLTYDGSGFTATSTLSGVMAFQSTLSGTVEADFNEEFMLTRVSGNDISVTFSQFDPGTINNIEFEIQNGQLTQFAFSIPSIKYNSIEFNIASVVFNNGDLNITASLTLPTLMVNVTDFKMDNMGTITIGQAEASVNSGPVNANINISYDGMVFMGGFSGSFGGIGSMSGTANFGAAADFNFGHFTFSIASSGVGIPLGGLRITGVAGEFGYNWEAGGSSQSNNCSSSGDPPPGTPTQGAITIGFGITVRDASGELIEACGYLQTSIASATTISLDLAVNILADSPHYFSGTAGINYTLGSSNVSGNLSSQFQIPPGSGNILDLNSSINFAVNGLTWTAGGTGDGTLFDVVNLDGGFSVSGNFNNGNFSGSANGTATYSNNFTYSWPSGPFDDCGYSVFYISGSLAVNINGMISATVNQDGVQGAISIDVDGSVTIFVAWPCVWCLSCPSTSVVNFDGDLSLEKTGSQTRLHGTLSYFAGTIDCDPDDPSNCEPPEESETGSVDFTL